MLTTRQAETLERIDAHIRKHGVSPLMREVARDMGVTKQAVSKLVGQLVARKYLHRVAGRVQGLLVLRKPQREAADEPG